MVGTDIGDGVGAVVVGDDVGSGVGSCVGSAGVGDIRNEVKSNIINVTAAMLRVRWKLSRICVYQGNQFAVLTSSSISSSTVPCHFANSSRHRSILVQNKDISKFKSDLFLPIETDGFLFYSESTKYRFYTNIEPICYHHIESI